MGDAAASGGYMIAYPCSMIVANAATRTGSIGSIFSLPNAGGLMDKLGLTTDRITYGPYAAITSLVKPWSAAEESIVVRQHWKSYNEWVEDIARVRGMTFAQVDTDRPRPRVDRAPGAGTLGSSTRSARSTTRSRSPPPWAARRPATR